MLLFYICWSNTVEFAFICEVRWKLLRTEKISFWTKQPSLTLCVIISSYQGDIGVKAYTVDAGKMEKKKQGISCLATAENTCDTVKNQVFKVKTT